MINQTQTVRQVPAWLSALLVIGCVVGAGWFLWTTWLGAGPNERIVILDRGPDDGIKVDKDGWNVRSGGAWLVAKKQKDSTDIVMDFRFQSTDFMTPDQVDILTKVRRVVTDDAMAKEAGVNAQQLAVFTDIRKKAQMELDAGDQAKMKELLNAWYDIKDKKEKEAAEIKVIKALDAIANKMRGPATRSAAERAALAKATLTSEQWDKLKSAGPEPQRERGRNR